MQGVLLVVVGVALMYLVLSGKMDCLIAAFRACAGTSEATTEAPTGGTTPVLPNPQTEAKAIIDRVLSPAA